MLIRTCAEQDVAVLDCYLPSGRNNVHAYHFCRQEAGDTDYLVAWRDRVPVGCGVLNWLGFRMDEPRAAHPGCPEISNLHVHEDWQGQGAGTALIREAERRILARGLRESGIGVGIGNPRAARLYQRLGYRDSGIRCTSRYTHYDADGTPHAIVEEDAYLVRDLTDTSTAD